MAYLLTWHGTLLCRHRQGGAVIHRPITSPFDDAEPVVLDLPADQLHVDLPHHLRAELPTLPANPPGALHSLGMSWSVDQRTLQFQRDGVFLMAEPDSDQVTLLTREDWEWCAFLPLQQSDLEALRQILNASWLIRSSGTLVTRPTMGQRFNLLVGELDADLRYQMPFDLSEWPRRLTLLRDGWRIDQICQYLPLIYYAAFGSDATVEQFAVSLHSLIEFGCYDGQIALITDRSPDDVARFLPAAHFARLIVIRCDARDRVAFMAARHLIMEWQGAWRYQPILYVDCDTVFDLEVAPMLHAIALSDRIAAPIEVFSPLASAPSVGSTLLQQDGCSPRFACGFNSGTLGIPNLTQHVQSLRLIRRLLVNMATLNGRQTQPWVDQEVANYVSYRIGNFDTGLISGYVRYGEADEDPRRRRGLVHFWRIAGGTEAKTSAMRDYLQRLAAAPLP